MSTSPVFRGESVNHTSERLLDKPITKILVVVRLRVCGLTALTAQGEESTWLPAEVWVDIVTVLPLNVVGGDLILVAVNTSMLFAAAAADIT